MRRIEKMMATLALAVSMMLGLGLTPIGASQADAAIVQVKFGNWMCSQGGSVTYTNVEFLPARVISGANGQAGRYSGWNDVTRGRRIQITGRILCQGRWPWQSYWQNINGYRYFWTTSNYQTYWF